MAAAFGCASCAAGPVARQVPNTALVGPQGDTVGARGLAERAPWSVFVFFSPSCDCLTVHEGRLVDLSNRYAGRGVRFYMVDSEAEASVGRDVAEARRRGYPFPILLDRQAHFADAVGAEYATYAVVLDSSGRVRYRGGIDSDRMHLHADATMYLANAIDDLLSGRAPRVSTSKSLGCSLERW